MPYSSAGSWNGSSGAILSTAGRVVTGTVSGALIESLGYVNFYLFTTVIAFPGIALFSYMMRRGFVDSSLGSVGKSLPADSPQPAARAGPS